MKFIDWIATQDEDDKLDLIDSIGNMFFENEVWERLDWLDVEYDKDEVRAWAEAEYARIEDAE